ncbi:lipopolysaccharide biosynthesis protein [Flavobacterium sp.]|jgi:O-antigen/teichoic acid export membrane protein|uniref:lipopolysaccharide biosynthesis protein n=1 Tax=Flavobacterium sp. TaxID=239 RepID=UPI0037C0080B
MNNNSRISNSVKNISFGLLTQVTQMILGFVSRTIFIQYLAIEYLGVNGLFTSILTMLSLAELGISSAILYALYKPLAEKSEEKIAALVRFFKKVYLVIAGIVAFLGLCVLPFLTQIVDNPPPQLASDLHVIYLLFLFNTVASYFFYYKISLFQADQKGYVISKRNIVVFIIQNSLQILSLVLFQNFLLYLSIQLVCQLGGNLYLSQLVKKHYPFLSQYKNSEVEKEVKDQIWSNLKSTALVKIGGLLVNNTSNIVLNYFSGLKSVGLLSNYTLLIGLASGLIMQVFASLTGSIANVNVKEPLEKKREIFNIVNFANFWVYGLASICFIVLVNDFITVWIGHSFTLSFDVVLILALNFYMVGMQNAVWTFKGTFGLFKYGRWLVIGTAIINVALSFLLGSYFGLFGILLSMAIARAVTNSWYDPYIVFTLALKLNAKDYFIKYFKYLVVLLFILGMLFGISHWIAFEGLGGLLFKLFLCLVITNLVIYLIYKNTAEMKYLVYVAQGILQNAKEKFKK